MGMTNWRESGSSAGARFGWPLCVLLAALLVLVSTGLVLDGPAGPRYGRRSDAAGRSVIPGGRPRSTPLRAALEFANSYLAFLYGRTSAADVFPASGALRRQLSRGQGLVTPAELQRQVVVRGLQLAPLAGRLLVADVRVDDGATPPYVLSFSLSLRDGRWIVERLGAGYRGRGRR